MASIRSRLAFVILALGALVGCGSFERQAVIGGPMDAEGGEEMVGLDAGSDRPATMPDAPIVDVGADVEADVRLTPDSGGDAACLNECAAGAKRCGKNGGVESCVSRAGCLVWGAAEACRGALVCKEEGGTAACKCPPAPGGCNGMEGKVCSGSMLATCARDADGCYSVATAACAAGKICQGTIPNALCSDTCTNACVAGTKRCGAGGGVQDCVLQGSCTIWSKETACTGAQSCKDEAGNPVCRCPAAPSGCNNVEGKFCSSTTLVGTCTRDVAGCLLASTAGCPSGKHCEGTAPGATCVDDCTPETDVAFCQRANARSCSTASGTDNCGHARSVAQCKTCSVTSCASDNYCTSLCQTTNFALGQKIAEVSADDQQDLLLGASKAGDVLLHLRRADCGTDTFTLFVSDREQGTFVSRDITSLAVVQALRKDQAFEPVSYLNISPDGRSLIGVSSDGRRFVRSARSAASAVDFAVATEGAFETINGSISASATAVLADPLMSGDDLAFYYHVINDTQLNGLYESVRKTTSDKFPAGTLLPGLVQGFQAVKGISADRLTILLFDINSVPWSTTILTRKDVTHAFSNPKAPNAAPAIPGFRDVVVGSCGTVIGNYTYTNCMGEDIYVFNAQ